MPNSSLKLKNILSEIDDSDPKELRAILDEFYPQDIAEEYHNLEREEKITLFDILSYKQGAEVLVELENEDVEEIFKELSDEQITKFTNHMELDDAADILGLLDDERMIRILENIQRPFEVKELMSHDPDTCGGIMKPSFISVREDLKIAAALRYVRLKAREEGIEIMYIFVTKKFGELVGIMSLRELFLAPDTDTVGTHMNTDVISVNASNDQEQATDLLSKYRWLALPVVNDNNQLVGIITIDDAFEVIEDETTEDIYQSIGINVETEDSANVVKSLVSEYASAYKARTPWILVTLLGQYMAASLIASYDATIAAIPIAISFMPLLSGLSGNIGNQSSTIMIRGISTGEVQVGKSSQILVHELIISLSIGLTCALVTGLMSLYVYHNQTLSMLIGLSLIISMMLAVAFGTITPFVFKKLELDPAAASGPLITTAIDIITFLVYLSLITKFVSVLV
ncbi:MAG: magnesium transporter [Candidatus Melainabacteria bacterium]|nr:magnesium transporter [Candidatus Melainabacteria bacterium]